MWELGGVGGKQLAEKRKLCCGKEKMKKKKKKKKSHKIFSCPEAKCHLRVRCHFGNGCDLVRHPTSPMLEHRLTMEKKDFFHEEAPPHSVEQS